MPSKKLNICLVQPDIFDPNMPARPAVIEIYGKYIPSLGHKVTWITPFNDKGREIQKGYFKEVRVYKIPTALCSSLIAKIFNKVSFLFREYKLLTNILKEEKYDIIQVRDNGLEALLALHVKSKYRIPFVFQYSFPKGLYKLYRNDPERRYQYYFEKFEIYILKHVLRKADFIFPISKWMETKLIKEGIPKSKMMSLPMGVNQELFSLNKSGMRMRKNYKLNGAQVIIYVGPMDNIREVDTIIHAFSKVKEHRDNVKLLMVGKGDDKINLEELALKLGIREDVIFTGQVPYFDVPYYIAVANICLSSVPPLSIYKVSSPTKLFEYMVMGKPVVANEEIPEQKEVIEESGGGMLVKFDAKSFAKGIIELLDNPERAKEMGEKGHEWVVKNRSYENMARQVEKRYFEILEK